MVVFSLYSCPESTQSSTAGFENVSATEEPQTPKLPFSGFSKQIKNCVYIYTFLQSVGPFPDFFLLRKPLTWSKDVKDFITFGIICLSIQCESISYPLDTPTPTTKQCVLLCFIPAVKPNFFRVDLTVNVSMSTTHPKEVIKTWVRAGNNVLIGCCFPSVYHASITFSLLPGPKVTDTLENKTLTVMNLVVNESGRRCVALIWFTDGQLFENLLSDFCMLVSFYRNTEPHEGYTVSDSVCFFCLFFLKRI